MHFLFKPKNLSNYADWVYYDNAFSKEECDAVKNLAEKFEKATTLNDADPNGTYSDNRSSSVFWLNNSQNTNWVYEKISWYVHNCNNARYNFDLIGFNEPIQLTKYDVGDYFDWHQDMGRSISWRKLSVVVQLSDPSEYQGGQLEFCGNSQSTPTKLGDLIIFPSYSSHRVTPIISGCRHSLVAWVSGPPYR